MPEKRRIRQRREILRINAQAISPPGGHYAHATCFGDLLFVSGMLPIRSDGTHTNKAPFDEQAQQALQNLVEVLHEGNSSVDNVLRVSAYIVGIHNWPLFNDQFAKVFQKSRPARAVIPVPTLHFDYLIEVEATAARKTRLKA